MPCLTFGLVTVRSSVDTKVHSVGRRKERKHKGSPLAACAPSTQRAASGREKLLVEGLVLRDDSGGVEVVENALAGGPCHPGV